MPSCERSGANLERRKKGFLTYRGQGRTYHYCRRNGQRQTIKGEFGHAEWRHNYDRIHATSEGEPLNAEPATGTVAAALRECKRGRDYLGAVADITGHTTMLMAKKYFEKKRRVRITVGHLDGALAPSEKKPDPKM